MDGDAGSRSIDAPLARRCLGALALSSGPMSIDAIAEVLWGEAVPANWKQSLRNVVAKLRFQLEPIGGGGDGVVVTTPTGYRLAAGCVVDVHRGLAAADDADESLISGDPDRALDLALAGIDRLGQPLFPDVDAGWMTGYRTRLEWARTRLMQVAAAVSRSIGRLPQAIDLAARAVADNPLNEQSYRELMTAHAASGDRAAALRIYESCRRTLAGELGISPDRATTDLHLEILGREPERPARHRPTGQLFGREDELAALRRGVAGEVLVSIVGPGGIGKSRLAAEFADDVGNGFDGARTFVDAQAMRDGSQLLTALTSTLGLRVGPDEAPIEAVVGELSGRGPTLLMLDGIDDRAGDAPIAASPVSAGR